MQTSIESSSKIDEEIKEESSKSTPKYSPSKSDISWSLSTPKESRFTTITFKMIYPTTYGQDIFIIGSHRKFGCWIPEMTTFGLKWSNGNVWSLTWNKKTLPKWSEFKFIIKNSDGSVEWEDRQNRAFDLNIIGYALRTSKNLETQGYALIDQRTIKLEYYPNNENVTLIFKWGM